MESGDLDDGPDGAGLSRTAESTLLTKSSSARIRRVAYCDRSSSWAISRPFSATTLPPTEREVTRLGPLRAIRALTAPVSTSISAGPTEVRIAVAGAVDGPTDSWRGPVRSGAAAMAWPDHSTEPSGQYARGQVCIGTDLPSAVVRWSGVSGWRAPFLVKGTPQLTPLGPGEALRPANGGRPGRADRRAAGPRGGRATARGRGGAAGWGAWHRARRTDPGKASGRSPGNKNPRREGAGS